MKLIFTNPYKFLTLGIISSIMLAFTKQTETEHKATSESSTKNKASIFEYFKKDKQFNIRINKPVNPFDPNGAPFELSTNDISARPGSAFDGAGELDIGPGPVYYKGWVKFFRFLFDDKRKGPKAFYENPEYKEQLRGLKSWADLEQKEDNMFKYVHSKNDFFLLAYKDELSFMKSKTNAFQTLFDTLKIEYISPVSEDSGYKGGITNMGSFKEGECFKVKTSNAGRWTWVICTDTPTEKLKLMGMIKKLVIKNQRGRGFINVGDKPGEVPPPAAPGSKPPTSLSGATLDSTGGNASVTLGKNINDGYWIILQDWSSCTKFCGGGTQTLHRFCVPPKPGGAPCEGQAIVERKCNEQPCPGTQSVKNDVTNSTEVETLKPILSVLPFSDRPQRYDKCHLKESDLLLTVENDYDPDKKTGPKIKAIQLPVRVVMNQYTISAYAGLNETDKRVSFDIKKVNFYTSMRDQNCFIFKESGVFKPPTGEHHSLGDKASISEAEFCPFGANGSPDVKEEWDYDFNLFKRQCHEQKGVSLVLNETEIEEELNKKKGQMRIDMINDKKKKLLTAQKEDGSTITKKVKENSMKAIQKELKLEQLIEQEIKETQQEALEMKAKELEREKGKLDCLNKAIKEKELENEYNMAQAAKDNRLDGIKNQVKNTINQKRERLKSKIAKLKKLSSSQMKHMEAQIMNIRLEMMNSLNAVNNFNPQKCRLLVMTKSEEEYFRVKKAYCDQKMADDPEDHRKCVSSQREDIIHLCCDYETNPDIPEDYRKCVKETQAAPVVKHDDVRFFWGKPYNRMATDSAMMGMIDQKATSSSFQNQSSMQQSSMHSSSMQKSSSMQESSSMQQSSSMQSGGSALTMMG